MGWANTFLGAKGSVNSKVALIFLFTSATTFATPQIIRVDGMIYDNAGNPISGSPSITVSAFAASTGGTALWTSQAYTPTVTKGKFTVDLDTSVGGGLVNQVASLTASGSVWFEISYNSMVVRPRVRARGAMFVLSAASADGFKTSSVSTQAPAPGQLLVYNGTTWVPNYLSAATLNVVSRAGDTMSGALNVGANITTLGTSQAATFTVTGLTASKLLLTDASGNLVSSSSNVTNTQLNYLVGVTGDIQTQLIGKQTAITVSTMVATGLLTRTGTGSPAIGSVTIAISTASATSVGLLASSDWNSFNSRAAAITAGVARAGDTMSGALTTPALTAVSVNVSGLSPGQLVRTTASSALTSVTALVNDAQLNYLNGVTAAIQPQLDALATDWGANPPGAVTAYAGGMNGNTTSGSNQITSLASTTGLQVGQQLAAPNIPVGSRITSIVSSSALQISSTAMSSVTGQVIVVPPAGYLLCDGSAVSRSTYATLYENVGSAWGQGDGSTTFNLPDLRGRFLRGQDWGTGIDGDASSRVAANTGGNAGDAVGSYEAGANASHTHTVTDPGHNHALSDPGHSHTVADPGHSHSQTYAYPASTSLSGGTYTAWSHSTATSGYSSSGESLFAATTGTSVAAATTGITVQNSGGNETRPVNGYVNYIIKY